MIYDFDEFLKRMVNLDYLDILLQADAECGCVEQSSYRVRGAPRRRKMGSGEYAKRIKDFLFFMRYGIRPGGASDSEFQSYRPVVETLVQKGQMKPEALQVFT